MCTLKTSYSKYTVSLLVQLTHRDRARGRATGAGVHRDMDEENKLQFPSLPASKEDLLVRAS